MNDCIIAPTSPSRHTELALATAGAQRFAEEINNEHRMARSKFIEHAIRCGELLLDQKDRVGHGNFGKWIEANIAEALAVKAAKEVRP